jgi:LysM repeat protein
MQIRITLIALFLFSSFNIFANIDSTGVQNNKGKKLIIHKVEPKETYYSLGRKYGVDPKSIMDFNNNIPLQIGTVLNIPTERPFDEESTPQKSIAKSKPRSVTTYVRHKVKSNETLSEIAEDYNTSVKTIQSLNNMRGTRIRVGQTLKVKRITTVDYAAETREPVSEPEQAVASAITTQAEAENTDTKYESGPKVNPARYGLKEQTERGIATMIDDPNIDVTRLLVLHRTAPVGTVMKVTNPVTEKSTFAKVVGQFTETESTKDVIILLTKAVADLIEGNDKRFQVIIDYGLSE